MIRFVYGGSGSGKSAFAEQLVVSCGAERKYYVATMKVYDDEGRRKVARHQKLRENKGFVTIEQPTCIGSAVRQIQQNAQPVWQSAQLASYGAGARPGEKSGDASAFSGASGKSESRPGDTAVSGGSCGACGLCGVRENLAVARLGENPEDASAFCGACGDSESRLGENPGGKCAVLLECVMNLVANEMFTPDGIVAVPDVIARVEEGLNELFSTADDVVVVSGNVFCDGIEYDETTKSYMRALAAVNAFVTQKADESFEIVAGIPLRIGSGESAA